MPPCPRGQGALAASADHPVGRSWAAPPSGLVGKQPRLDLQKMDTLVGLVHEESSTCIRAEPSCIKVSREGIPFARARLNGEFGRGTRLERHLSDVQERCNVDSSLFLLANGRASSPDARNGSFAREYLENQQMDPSVGSDAMHQ
jgi:hypothetical protein